MQGESNINYNTRAEKNYQPLDLILHIHMKLSTTKPDNTSCKQNKSDVFKAYWSVYNLPVYEHKTIL